MTTPFIVSLSGSSGPQSRTRILAETAGRRVAERFGKTLRVHDLDDFQPDLGSARRLEDLGPRASAILDSLRTAEAIVVAVPVYKGSYPGLFKHLIDLLAPDFFAGKPVLLAATGGGDRHALVVEHQLRPLFSFFTAQALGIGLYACERDYLDGRLVSEAVLTRLQQAVEQFGPFLARDDSARRAALA